MMRIVALHGGRGAPGLRFALKHSHVPVGRGFINLIFGQYGMFQSAA